MACPSCSALVPEGARFCPSCGHPLQAPSDERRVVTVLFGDLVGFTSLSETRDPETVKNLVDRCFARLATDITDHGGRVDKVVGDAVVALFGAPTAHEDDAERAVRAALAMQRSLDEQAAAVEAPLRLRIGVNTGEVLVGALRAGGDYTAMGDVVNSAARLQTAATPGQVVVGPDTHAATRGVVRFEPLGPVYARGRDEPIEAWAAIEAVSAPGRRPRRTSAPLLGRDAEMGLLCSALTTAITYRRPQLAVLVGEAGMGKSRLAEEVAAVARADHGALVIDGHTPPYGEADRWAPLTEALRQAFGLELGVPAADVRRQVHSVLGESPDAERACEAMLFLLGRESRLGDVDPARIRDEVSRAVRVVLTELAERHPVVLTLSDVQWADPVILEVLDGLLGAVHHHPLVVLLTARPGLEDHWRPAPGRHNLVVLNLDPLDDCAAHLMLTALLGHEPDSELEATLIERSGGNPFFLEELAALLEESGALAPGASSVPVLPATLRGLVAARLDALPASERAVLEDAAVLGRRGPVMALDALGKDAGRGPADGALLALEAKDLLVVRDGEVGFGSDLVREVAYGTLTKGERARRHASLAGWGEEWLSEKERSDELLEELARHYAAAAELVAEVGSVPGVPADIRERALDALDKAAERAEDRETNVTSARLYEQQLRLVGPSDRRRRHALIGRARALSNMRRLDEARADLATALAEAGEAGDHLARARALTVLGEAQGHAGHYADALATLDEAGDLWRQLDDRRGEASALRRRGMVSLFSGDPDGAEPAIEEALEAFKELGSRRGVAWANQNLAWISFTRGQEEDAEERLRSAIDLFADIGDWGGLGWALGLLGWVRFAEGHMAEAERLAVQTANERNEDPWARGMMTVLLSAIRLWQGRSAEAISHGESARRVFEGLDDAWGQARALGPLSRALLVAGRRPEAEEVLATMDALALRFPPSSLDRQFPLLARLGVAVHAGEGARALAAAEPAAEFPEPWRSAGVEGTVAVGLALVQAGRPDEAVGSLETAVARAGGPGALTYARSSLALALAAAGRGDEAATLAAAVAAGDGGTYLDRVVATLAAACVAAAGGGEDAALAALAAADDLLAPTDDQLSRAIAALASARVLEALGRPEAPDVLAGARSLQAEVGAPADGWDTAFRLAAGLP